MRRTRRQTQTRKGRTEDRQGCHLIKPMRVASVATARSFTTTTTTTTTSTLVQKKSVDTAHWRLTSGRVTRRRGNTAAAAAAATSDEGYGAKPWDETVNGPDPISNDVLLSIVRSELSDEAVNKLVWNALGYRCRVELDAETLTAVEVWTPDEVFPNWAKNYPQPPDVIGVTRKYDPKVDAPVKAACAALTRSVPEEHKQGLKTTLTPLGWKGFKMEGLTPNMTRRAQAANWLLFYRRELRGVTIEELRARRDARRAKEEAEGKTDRPTGTTKQGVV